MSSAQSIENDNSITIMKPRVPEIEMDTGCSHDTHYHATPEQLEQLAQLEQLEQLLKFGQLEGSFPIEISDAWREQCDSLLRLMDESATITSEESFGNFEFNTSILNSNVGEMRRPPTDGSFGELVDCGSVREGDIDFQSRVESCEHIMAKWTEEMERE